MSLSDFAFGLEFTTQAMIFLFACLTIGVWAARRFGSNRRRSCGWLAIPVMAYGMFLLEMERLSQPHRFDHVVTVKKKRKKSSANTGGKKRPGNTEAQACDSMSKS